MKKSSYSNNERGLNRADRRDRRRQKRENNEHIVAPLDNGKYLPRLTENIPLVPKNAKQSFLISCIHNATIIFALGPAGTGKTHIPATMALQGFKSGLYDRIVIVRPMVADGEDIGFLPGDINEKFAPYFTPVKEIFGNFLSDHKIESLMELGKIEAGPPNFMRGRTLNKTFIIVDESQNLTPSQVETVITRVGEGSKIVFTGDHYQCDIIDELVKKGQIPGLLDALTVCHGMNDVEVVAFDEHEVVRSGVAGELVRRYNRRRRLDDKTIQKFDAILKKYA